MRTYSFGYAKLRRADYIGMELGREAVLLLQKDSGSASLSLPPLDGEKEGAGWGRLHIEAEFPEKCLLTLYAAAGEDPLHRPEFKVMIGINQKDVLLYELQGRYLWFHFEIQNGGGGAIQKIQVYNPGDHFLQTFPEIYQERNSLFHRYLSVFSSVYHDFAREAEAVRDLFEVQKSPDWYLPRLGWYLGVDVGSGLLTEQEMRVFIEKIPLFNRMKGTPSVMKEITQLLTGERPFLLEKENGSVIFLLNRKLTQSEELRLLFFLLQFKTKYSRLLILSYEEETGMDQYCFCDINGVLKCQEEGYLDTGASLEGCIIA